MADESQYRLRIPADLKAKLEAAARDAGRSMNAQVLKLIEDALGQQGEIEALRDQIADHDERMKEMERDIVRLLDSAGLMYDHR